MVVHAFFLSLLFTDQILEMFETLNSLFSDQL